MQTVGGLSAGKDKQGDSQLGLFSLQGPQVQL